MAPSFLLLHDITNEKTLKLKQIDRLPALPRFSPQKHIPTTLVGIPVDIYTLVVTANVLYVSRVLSCDLTHRRAVVTANVPYVSRVLSCDLMHRRAVVSLTFQEHSVVTSRTDVLL